jgi:hypothetical protein
VGKAKLRQRQYDHRGRLATLAEILAVEAAQDAGVRAFRRDVLGGTFLAPEQIEFWLLLARENALSAHDVSTPVLHYAVPGQRYTAKLPISSRGVLGRLQRLAARLARKFGWQEAQSTLFVLTGAVPELAAAPAAWIEHRAPYGSMARIHVSFDPAMTLREAAEIYASARRQLVGARYRPPTPRMLAVAQFTAPYFEPGTLRKKADAPAWRTIMTAWNATCTGRGRPVEWRYRQPSTFAYHATVRARAKVLMLA